MDLRPSDGGVPAADRDVRTNVWLTPELKKRIVAACAQETLRTGDRVSLAEWLRVAAERRLESGT